jgi:hypothetical protein
MKTKVEINGYEIEIEEMDGRIVVKATKENEDGEDEVIEEFTLDGEGEEGEEGESGEDVQGFEEFEGGEEEGDFEEGEGDFDGEGIEDLEDLEEFEDDSEDEVKLESFQSFVNKRK